MVLNLVVVGGDIGSFKDLTKTSNYLPRKFIYVHIQIHTILYLMVLMVLRDTEACTQYKTSNTGF